MPLSIATSRTWPAFATADGKMMHRPMLFTKYDPLLTKKDCREILRKQICQMNLSGNGNPIPLLQLLVCFITHTEARIEPIAAGILLTVILGRRFPRVKCSSIMYR
jgi:hypothetical protein